nr:hypothetical protein [Tanacetum cinerariifolium]
EAPSSLVILYRILECLDIDRWNGGGSCKGSKEVGVLQKIHRDLVDRDALSSLISHFICTITFTEMYIQKVMLDDAIAEWRVGSWVQPVPPLKDLQYRCPWSFKPRGLSREAQIDDCYKCPPRLEHVIGYNTLHVPDQLRVAQFIDKVDQYFNSWWRNKFLIAVDWCNLKSFPQGVFGEDKPLFIQLVPEAPSSLVILYRILECLDIDRWNGGGSCKGSKEVGVLQKIHRDLVDRDAL